jgi:DNA-binding protein HU-beta
MGIMDIVKGKGKGASQPTKTLYTSDIVRAVARKQRYSQRTVATILNSLVGEVEATVAQGNSVQLTNFGTFYSVFRKPSKGRNLRTNAVIDIPSMYLARFRPGAALKQSVRRKKR